jgi:hypothetical protein
MANRAPRGGAEAESVSENDHEANVDRMRHHGERRAGGE